MKNKRKVKMRSSAVIALLSAVIIALSVLIGIVSAAYVSQMRLNQFSKNIIFSDNYFLRNLKLGEEQKEEEDSEIVYAYKDAEIIVGTLFSNSNVIYTGSSIFYYHRLNELSTTDVYAYYYNTFKEISVRFNFGYFLFTKEIREITKITEDKDEQIMSKDDLLSHISALADYSLEWEPTVDHDMLWTDNGPVYVTNPNEMIEAEEDSYLDPEWENIKKQFTQNVTTWARDLLDSGIYEDGYNFDLLCRLYYDSLSRTVFDHPIALTTSQIMLCLKESEFGEKRSKLKILEAEHISQLPDYPNGCEAVTAVMLLKYAGYDVQKADFIENHLKKGEIKNRLGIRFGPDPEKEYAGDPASENGGWGCFAPAIVNAIDSYLAGGSERSHSAQNVSGATLTALCENFIDAEMPVAIWVTQDFSAVSEVYQWLSYDRENVYLYPKNQHCVMLVGYDSESYYICDPLKDEEISAVPRQDLELSFASMGFQAVVLTEYHAESSTET